MYAAISPQPLNAPLLLLLIAKQIMSEHAKENKKPSRRLSRNVDELDVTSSLGDDYEGRS